MSVTAVSASSRRSTASAKRSSKALQAQINPHFLFNTLGTINSLAVLEDAESISQVVAILGDFLRYTIDADQILVTLGEELEQVKRYVALQKYPVR